MDRSGLTIDRAGGPQKTGSRGTGWALRALWPGSTAWAGQARGALRAARPERPLRTCRTLRPCWARRPRRPIRPGRALWPRGSAGSLRTSGAVRPIRPGRALRSVRTLDPVRTVRPRRSRGPLRTHAALGTRRPVGALRSGRAERAGRASQANAAGTPCRTLRSAAASGSLRALRTIRANVALWPAWSARRLPRDRILGRSARLGTGDKPHRPSAPADARVVEIARGRAVDDSRAGHADAQPNDERDDLDQLLTAAHSRYETPQALSSSLHAIARAALSPVSPAIAVAPRRGRV